MYSAEASSTETGTARPSDVPFDGARIIHARLLALSALSFVGGLYVFGCPLKVALNGTSSMRRAIAGSHHASVV